MSPRARATAKLTLALYPLGAGAAAVNLFFASLIGSWVGLPVLSPGASVLGGMALGVPATWAFARHIRRMMEDADRGA